MNTNDSFDNTDGISDDNDMWAGLTAQHLSFLQRKFGARLPKGLRSPYFFMITSSIDDEKRLYSDLCLWGWIENFQLSQDAKNFFDQFVNPFFTICAQVRVHNTSKPMDKNTENGFPPEWEGTELPLLLNFMVNIDCVYTVTQSVTVNGTPEYNINCFYANANDLSIFDITTESDPYRAISEAYRDLIDPDNVFPPAKKITKPIKANKDKVNERAIQANKIYREKVVQAEENGEEYKGNVFTVLKTLPDNGSFDSKRDEDTMASLGRSGMAMSSTLTVPPDFSKIPKDWRIVKDIKFPFPMTVDVCCYVNEGMVITVPSEIQQGYCYYHPFSVEVMAKGLRLLVENPQEILTSSLP